MKEKQRYVMTMIAVCGLVGASLGINLGSSGLFYNAISADLGITKASISMTYTIAAMAAAVSGLFIARILKNEKNLKPMILIGVILSAAGMILMTRSAQLCHGDQCDQSVVPGQKRYHGQRCHGVQRPARRAAFRNVFFRDRCKGMAVRLSLRGGCHDPLHTAGCHLSDPSETFPGADEAVWL